MNRRNFLLFGMAFMFALAAQAQSSKLAVEVSYTGSGAVNESHKLYVVLWDTPDFVKSSSAIEPIAIKAVTSKSAAAQFDEVQKNPVYVSMVYDPAGKWDATSAPPAGASLGLYAKGTGHACGGSASAGEDLEDLRDVRRFIQDEIAGVWKSPIVSLFAMSWRRMPNRHFYLGGLHSAYVRGQAFVAAHQYVEAVAEFQKLSLPFCPI